MTVPTPHAAALASIPVREAEVSVLGSATRYWEYGPRDAANTILLVHGYRGDHHGLEGVVALLPGIRFISPDLPGFGASTPMTDAPHSVAGYERWLTAFAAAAEVPADAIVLGHSFGSMITTHALADGFPAPALILLNPISADPKTAAGAGITGLTRAWYGLGRRLPAPIGRRFLGNWAVVQFMSMNLVTTDDPQLRRWVHEEHHRFFNGFSDAKTAAEAFDASLSTQVGEAAPRVTVPVLMIAGEGDRIAPLAGQQATVKLFPDARLVVLPIVGHLAHYEAAQGVADAIRGFVDAL
ncbi:MAG TPA: alpha/beta hydrolase [Pseudolysinimonas sp.]|jgi:pimeloyl-ACP methyl ester carboxylesterase